MSHFLWTDWFYIQVIICYNTVRGCVRIQLLWMQTNQCNVIETELIFHLLYKIKDHVDLYQ